MITLFKIKKISQKGFTLIELLTSIAVVIILSAIVFANYRSGERQYALQRSTHKLAQDIRRIQEMATSTREFKCSGYPNPIIPPGGYGVYFPNLSPTTNNYYILFADCNGDSDYDSGEQLLGGTVNLEKGITISSHVPPANQSQAAWVLFTPPDPTTIFNKDNNNSTLTITLTTSSNPPKTKEVKMNTSGLIEVP